MIKLMQKALTGDLSAILMVRDTIGEKPSENVNVDTKVTNNSLEKLTTEELKALIKNNDSKTARKQTKYPTPVRFADGRFF